MKVEIELSEDLIEERAREVINRKISKVVTDLIEEKFEELVNPYSRLQRRLEDVAAKAYSRSVRDQVERNIEKVFYTSDIYWSSDQKEKKAFESGVKAAYISMTNFLTDEKVKEKIIEKAGKSLAMDIKLNPSRNKRIAEILKEEFKE